MASTNFLENEQAIAIAALVGAVIVLFIIKRLILVRLKAKARSEKSSMSDIYRVLVLSLNAPLNLLIWVIFLRTICEHKVLCYQSRILPGLTGIHMCYFLHVYRNMC